jgi:cell division protein FtsQ
MTSRTDRARKLYERAEMRRFTRRARQRRLGWLVAGGLVLLLGLFVAVAVYSPILALRTITVSGTARLDPAEIVEAISGQEGVPLALIDEARIRQELSAFPLIRSYSTEVVPPDTLLIHVIERSPIGVVATPSGFNLVDPAGIVVETSAVRPPGVPLIEVGQAGVNSTGFLSMAEVLVALHPAVLAQVDTITARTRDDVILSIIGSQQRVVWGSADDSDFKAQVFAALLARFGGSGPGEYDVSAPGSPVFRSA